MAQTTVAADADQVAAAREGLGPDGILLVDGGTVWKNDLERAASAAGRAEAARRDLAGGAVSLRRARRLQDAGDGGGAGQAGGRRGLHNVLMARHMIDHAGIGFVQIDAGRIGGITPARDVALYARPRGVTYVNHTFTSHLALAASLQPFADSEKDEICEYPVEPKALAIEITHNHIGRDANGQVSLPDAPGLGVRPNIEAANRYLVPTEIRVGGKTSTKPRL